jgi:hypothetical protein
VAADAIEQAYLDREEFAAVLSSDFIANDLHLDEYGPTSYTGDHVDQGVPSRDLLS